MAPVFIIEHLPVDRQHRNDLLSGGLREGDPIAASSSPITRTTARAAARSPLGHVAAGADLL